MDQKLFYKSKPFETFLKNENHSNKLSNQNGYNNGGWEWYDPSHNSTAVTCCMETGLHGLKYIVQPKRHIFERMFWLWAFLASTVVGIGLTYQMIVEYKETPIITVISPTGLDIQEIPFPSVTICNVNSLKKSEVNRLFSALGKLKEEATATGNMEMLEKIRAQFFDIDHICDTTLPYSELFQNHNFAKYPHTGLYNRSEEAHGHIHPSATLRKLSQPCHKMILNCLWMSQPQKCEELFFPIETEFGSCCTFNMIPITEEYASAEDVMEWKSAKLDYDHLVFNQETETAAYPYSQQYAGRRGGLSFTLNPDLDEYYCPNTDSEGFILNLNVPVDVPLMKDFGDAIKTNSEVFVAVEPKMVVSDESVRDYQLDTRACYFSGEYDLRHYIVYSDSNCRMECITRVTMEKCNCTLYFMPQSPEAPLCKPDQYNCAKLAKEEVFTNGLVTMCDECYSTCNELSYKTKLTYMTLQKAKIKALLNSSDERDKTLNSSVVHVYFDDDEVTTNLMKEAMPLVQLLANIGGLLGVCIGCSIISLLEIFYFSTLRVCCSAYHERSNVQDNDEGVRMVFTKRGYFSRWI